MSEVFTPESDKFTASVVLVHGLWGQPSDWRRFGSYLAHRGWRCIAVDRSPAARSVGAAEMELRAAIARLDSPPVVIGHDFGAHLALCCADVARAVVAIAPITGAPPARGALRRSGTWLERLRGSARHPPRGGPYLHRAIAEPAALIGEIAADVPLPALGGAPRTVFAMEQDEIVPVEALRSYAAQIDAELHVVPAAGHAILDAPHWERCVAAVHRWIIRQLGVDLLALYDEAWEGREP